MSIWVVVADLRIWNYKQHLTWFLHDCKPFTLLSIRFTRQGKVWRIFNVSSSFHLQVQRCSLNWILNCWWTIIIYLSSSWQKKMAVLDVWMFAAVFVGVVSGWRWCGEAVEPLLPGDTAASAARLCSNCRDCRVGLSRQHKSMIAIINPGKIEVELWRAGEEENRLYLVQPSLPQLCTPDTLILLSLLTINHHHH